MRKPLLVVFMIQVFCASTLAQAGAPRIEEFSTDGCSAAPDGAWRDCCTYHDLSYWMGGTAEDKLKADEGLRSCINKRVREVGTVYYYGVRAGGSPNFPTPWRWGYGWPEGRGYKKLNLFEKRTVSEVLDNTCMYGGDEGLIVRFMKEKKIPMDWMKMMDVQVFPKPEKKKNQQPDALDRYKVSPF